MGPELKRYLRRVLERHGCPKEDLQNTFAKYNLLSSEEKRTSFKKRKHIEAIQKELRRGEKR